MCGISGIIGPAASLERIRTMVEVQRHRGPDAEGIHLDLGQRMALGHNRLSIIDLSQAGRQPMADPDGRLWIVFNGEIYNYLELRHALQSEFSFRTRTDTEVLLAAYQKWGAGCLDRLIGMFAFAVWDVRTATLFCARDRFGVKPLYYHAAEDGSLFLASEIKALHAAGIPAEPDLGVWSTYLSAGVYDHSERTFWKAIKALPPGHTLQFRWGRHPEVHRWYDVSAAVGPEFDPRSDAVVKEEYETLLKESVALRFRSDVRVGINLSGGLDSSVLLALVQAVQGRESDVEAFTFITGDERYDELSWVQQMLLRTRHPSVTALLSASEVPGVAAAVQASEDEPFGGLPTLAYARLFEVARSRGVLVLLDGQGMDEQWAGYDYYSTAVHGHQVSTVQGTSESPVRPGCLEPDFLSLSEPFVPARPFPDPLRNAQYRDLRFTKIPRALRFNDRISMRVATELREPFLDHRLVELALRQPAERKIREGRQKLLLRAVARDLLPSSVIQTPKRPLQTPQREWLRGELREWASAQIEAALRVCGWLERSHVEQEWQGFLRGDSDNSFYVWQWISIALVLARARGPMS